MFLLYGRIMIAQPNEWTWMKGDNIPGQAGSYGVIGIPSPANKPGARYEACQWTDLQGNFWLYGGGIVNTRFSDLWMFNLSTLEWTWMHGSQALNAPAVYGTKGIPGPLNTPGGNGFGVATWTDLSGNLWMYGGNDGVNGSLNDLWKYDVLNNEWTWMHGDSIVNTPAVYGTMGTSSPLNTPGARCETSCTWTDNNGDLWLFGGTPNGPGASCNDLWKYHIASNEWTWMKGGNIPNQPGVYGLRGVAAPANTPGGRWCYTSWKDNTGNLWLFGGIDASSIIGMGFFNDLWMYDIASNQWTWMTGSSGVNQSGIYPANCLSSTLTTPGARGETRACWKDDCNNLWLLGGRDQNFDLYNDLWRYDLNVNRWFWVSGSNLPNQNSVFGTFQVPSPSNVPCARMGAVSWTNNTGLWLFGGYDYSGNEWNDLWKFTVQDSTCGRCLTQPVALFTAPNNLCPGTCCDFVNLSQGANSFQWIFQGANPGTSNDASPVNICYNSPGNYDVTLIASNSLGNDTLTLNNYITVFPYPPPQAILQSGDTLFANAGAVTYQWYHNGILIPGATASFYIAPESGDYNVVATDNNGCEVEAVIFDVIARVQSVAGNSNLAVYPNPAENTLTVNCYMLNETATVISICNMMGEKTVSVQRVASGRQPAVLDVSDLFPGVYFLEINVGKNIYRIKFVKQ